MKKALFLPLFVSLLFGAFLCSCAADEEDTPLVTEVVIAPTTTVAPGDEVTVTAQGFNADDQIMFRVTWPLTGEVIKEGYAVIWGIIMARDERSITFLAPGGYPAGVLEVRLLRRDKSMSLGRLPISDGQAPAEYSLYGVLNYLTGYTGIDRIDMTSGGSTPICTLDAGEQLTCVVNNPGTNSIYGISLLNNTGTAVCYDLTMRYYRNSGNRNVIMAGTLGHAIGYLMCEDDLLMGGSLNTRTSPPQPPLMWDLPTGITAGMLSKYPFITSDRYIMQSAHTAAGTFRPLALDLSRGGNGISVGDPVEADALVPFRMLVRSENPGVGIVWVGGYAVAQQETTRLHLFDPSTMTFGEPMAEVPGKVVSITVMPVGEDAVKMYMLCEDGNTVRHIRVYDTKTKQLTTLPGDTPYYSEIVLAK